MTIPAVSNWINLIRLDLNDLDIAMATDRPADLARATLDHLRRLIDTAPLSTSLDTPLLEVIAKPTKSTQIRDDDDLNPTCKVEIVGEMTPDQIRHIARALNQQVRIAMYPLNPDRPRASPDRNGQLKLEIES